MAARSVSALGALGVAIALSLSGCSLAAQVTTNQPYDASDGTGGNVGSVLAQNLLLITSGEGEPAALIGSLYNDSNESVDVRVTVAEHEESFSIPAMSSVTLGLADGNQNFVTDAPVAPGRNSQVSISVDGDAQTTKPLPVLDGTLPEYQRVVEELASYED